MRVTPRTLRGRLHRRCIRPTTSRIRIRPWTTSPTPACLYVDSLLYARKERWTHVWELKLGVVGPASQADNVQKDFHDLIGGDEPMGWDTQLPNEPVINIGYTVAHLAAAGHAGGSAQWRVVPVGTVGVGNVLHRRRSSASTEKSAGISWTPWVEPALRTGFNAASTVGVGPVKGWSVSFFGGLGGYGVAHYLPLDGTVFHDSRSVDSEPFIGTGSLGRLRPAWRIRAGLRCNFLHRHVQ